MHITRWIQYIIYSDAEHVSAFTYAPSYQQKYGISPANKVDRG